MIGRLSALIEHVGAHVAVLSGEIPAVATRGDAEEPGDRGRDIDQASRPRDETIVADTLARDHERRTRLEHSERPVLTRVAALVFPVVRAGVHDAEVGRRGMVEQLRRLLVREGVRVVPPVRMGVGELGFEAGEASRRLVGERVVALGRGGLEAFRGAAKGHFPVGAGRLELVVAGALEDHIDDRRQLRVEQDPERTASIFGHDGKGTGRFGRLFRGRLLGSASGD